MSAATGESDSSGQVWDVVVIGAGVAGCVIAREMAREGFRVLLVESKPFPRPKVCGACLNGMALAVFERAGLMDTVLSAGAVPVLRFEAMRNGRSVQFPLRNGLAVSRTALDPMLAQAAVDEGVTFQDHTTAFLTPADASEGYREIRLQSPKGDAHVRSKVVVVAAGLSRTCFGQDSVHRTLFAANAKLGAGCTLNGAPASYRSDVVHMAIGRHGYLGMVRVEGGQLNVAGAFDPDFLKLHGTPGAAAIAIVSESGFAPLPELGTARWIGTPPLTRRTRPLAGHRLFLVGDAAGYVEPFTGEGMGWALASVLALKPIVAKSVDHWSPRFETEWEAVYERVVGRRQGICRGLASILNRPILSDIVFRAARIAPAIASLIVRRIDSPSQPALEGVRFS